MGRRRRHFFVLLFVLALVIVSGIVIASKPTKLGLDLKGGLELVYQGTPTGQVKEVSGEDIERAIEIIRQRIDQLGVSEPEVARLGEKEISVDLPDITDPNRAREQVGTTAQLYFYNWEKNLIARERTIGGTPGQNPPAGPLKEAKEEWKEAGRAPKKGESQEEKQELKAETEQLIFSGAFPSAYGAVKLASEQKPVPLNECGSCTTTRPSFYLFSEDNKHKLISGPQTSKKDLYISATGTKIPHRGEVVTVPVGTVVVKEYPQKEGKVIEGSEPGWYALNDEPALTGTEITNPTAKNEESGPIVTFEFTESGRENFHEVTREIAQHGQERAIGLPSSEQVEALSGHFAVVLDNEVKTRPIINFQENPDGIDGRQGAQISGGFTGLSEAQELAETLQIGALPINLKLISQTQVSATLGTQALHEGLKAGIIGLALVVIFLLIFYRVLGAIAVLALGAYGVIFFALIKLIPITLTLPGIAGLILTIGVAADSNIVIFERIKEEVRAGRSMPNAIAAGYRRGIATIVDANVVTLLTAFILFVLATSGVKGFAFTLGVGTITSLLTAVVFTQALLLSMSRSRLLSSPSVLGAGEKRFRWRFDFMGSSRWFFSFSGTILIIGALALAIQGLNFGIDFESGTRITAALVKPTEEEGVREALEKVGISGEVVQQVSNPELGNNVFQIQTKNLSPGKARKALSEEFGIAHGAFESTTVGPTFGEQVAESALKALIFSMLVICAYIAFRFDPKFAVPVLIALFHDILITAGVYSLTGKEVSSGTVAAFLTILGYSLYDTIIVFDRIRENMPRMPRAAFSQIVNRSMSEVLTRSLATSFTTLLAVTSLLVFGGATLQDFAFAMLVGIASGTYSSIFIASPVLTAWKEREPGFARRRARIAELSGSVPAYADEVELAKLADDSEAEAGAETGAATAAEPQQPRGAVATVEPPAGEGGGSGDGDGAGEAPRAGASANGEKAAAEQASAERRERNAARRARRQQRRKHGRNR